VKTGVVLVRVDKGGGGVYIQTVQPLKFYTK